jgi:hypothetical protein
MSSLGDILTSIKNGVIGINNVYQALSAVISTNVSLSVTADTLIVTGKGRLLSFSVLSAGSGDGAIYNYNSITTPPASSQVICIPQTVGYYSVNIPFVAGLVLSPGTGQNVSVTYSRN